jgi:hypothetical protein
LRAAWFARFRADAEFHPLFHPAARLLPIVRDGPIIAPSVQWKARRPWQDRWMLMDDADLPRTSASRRLAHGVRPFLETMKDNRNVRYSPS